MWHALIVAVLLSVPLFVTAAPDSPASDNAGNYTNWFHGSGGGSGMSPWAFTTTTGDPNLNGHFLAVNNFNCNIATSTKCWAMYANTGQTAGANRSFSGAMAVGSEVFTIFMDNGSVNTGGSVGFDLRNGSGERVLTFLFPGGASYYRIEDSGGTHDSTVGFTNTGLKIEVFLPTASTYRMNISTATGTWLDQVTGSLLNPSGGQSVNGFRLFNFNAGSFNDAFFNSISVATGTLAVTLADFHAVQQGDAVLVTWETASELNNRGFNLYRGTSPDGWDRQLNTALIPSQSQGSPGGFVYTWEDRAGLVAGTTYYWLQDVDTSGAMTMHGPVSVDYTVPTAVTLSGVQASPAAGAMRVSWRRFGGRAAKRPGCWCTSRCKGSRRPSLPSACTSTTTACTTGSG